MQSNVNGIMDDYNEFPDSWVEIYNEDSIAFDFTGYSISLSKDFTESYPLMDSTVIEPNGYLLFLCDKEDYGGRHADFRLNSDEDSTLYLFDPVGHIVDSLFIPKMLAPNIAYGRIGDTDSFSYYKKATPGGPNTGSCMNTILKKPRFSVRGGIYNRPVVLRLSLQGEHPSDAVVRYTTNGSEPTEDSPVAPDSLLIAKTTVVRAKTFSDSALSKMSVTHTYIIADRKYTLPVVSLTLDSAYLYDDELGILVEGTYADHHPGAVSDMPVLGSMNYLFSWDRPVNFEYFDVTGTDPSAVVNQLCEVEIGGNSTPALQIKSLNLKSVKRFGEKSFSYAFWKDKPNVKKSKTLYLRDGGQDFMCAHIRDAFNQMSFGQNVDLDWQACQPVVVLLNGEYYGMVNLREKMNKDYVWSNFNKLENIDMVEENSLKVRAGNLEQYDIYYYFTLLPPFATYERCNRRIDLEEFGNYFVMNALFSNSDFPFNNQMLWKERDNNKAKWRFLSKDLDMTDGFPYRWSTSERFADFDFPYLNYILQNGASETWTSSMLQSGVPDSSRGFTVFKQLMEFPEFRNQFIDKASVYMGTFASENSLLARFDSLNSIIDPEIPYYYDAIGRNLRDLNRFRNEMRDWLEKRVPFFYHHMHQYFELGDTTSVTIRGYNKRQLYFNGVKVKDNRFDGRYFYGRPIYLSRSASAYSYEGNSISILKEDSVSNKADGSWWIHYTIDDKEVTEQVDGKSLYYTIREGAKNVVIIDSFYVDVPDCQNLKPIVMGLPDTAITVQLDTSKLVKPSYTDVFGSEGFAKLADPEETFGAGESVFSWIVELPNEKYVSCEQKLTVYDTTAPKLDDCLNMEPMYLYLAENQCAIDSQKVVELAPVAVDNGHSLLKGELLNKEEVFEDGNYWLNWLFTDASGNGLFCIQPMYVRDTIAPKYWLCDSMPAVTYILKDVRADLTYEELDLTEPVAIDNCGLVDGYLLKETDDVPIGISSVAWVFKDDHANMSYCVQNIVVIDSFAPEYNDCLSMPSLLYELEDNSSGIASAELTDLEPPVAEDNLGLLKADLVADDTLTIGWNVLYWQFLDASSNMTVCLQPVLVLDRCAPVYDECENMPTVVYELKDNVCWAPAEQIHLNVPVATDNSGVSVVGQLVNPVPFYNIGLSQHWWQFLDESGNELFCQQYVEVKDKCAPYINCADIALLQLPLPLNETKVKTTEVKLPIPYAYDNCNQLVEGRLEALPEFFVEGDNPITWRFTDASGNESVCRQNISMMKNFKLYVGPVPTTSTLTIGGLDDGTPMVFTDAEGKVIMELESMGSPMFVNVSTWSKGVYFVRIKGEVFKIIKD